MRPRLRQVIVAISEGKTFKQIAHEWGRCVGTVEYSWWHAKKKYGLKTPVDAVKFALRQKWITLEGSE